MAVTGSIQARIALNRFGLGARPGDISVVSADPAGWLARQIALPAAAQIANVPSAADRIVLNRLHLLDSDLLSRLAGAVASPAPFIERLALFWSSHLAVSAARDSDSHVVVPYENEAIRPYVTARYADMLKASSRHQAMLIYLDLNGQIGPHSARGIKSRQSFNEDYARELMELHTVGPIYTQTDVDELALALTGWAIDRATGLVAYDTTAHEPGERCVLGAVLPAGDGQANAAIAMLVSHPATAQNVCAKLAGHFISDVPSPDLVAAMVQAWGADGALSKVYAAMLGHPAAWTPAAVKYRTPEQFVIASARALQLLGMEASLLHHQRALGQRPFLAPSPQGYPDDEAAWLTPNGVLLRVDAAASLASFATTKTTPLGLMSELLAPNPASHTSDAVRAAPSRIEAFGLMLASPEFQRS